MTTGLSLDVSFTVSVVCVSGTRFPISLTGVIEYDAFIALFLVELLRIGFLMLVED